VPPVQPYPPSPQYPPTQQLPPTQAFPVGPPGGFPPQGYSPGGSDAPPPAKKTGLIIALGLVVVAAIVAAVLVLTSGDDDDSSDVSIVLPTTVEFTLPVTIPVTIPPLTLPTDDTLSITLPTATEAPSSTEAPVTEPPTTDAGPPTSTGGSVPADFVKVTDDLNFFSVMVPPEFESTTTPITTQDDFTLPSVTAADDVNAYNGDDVTRGLTVVGIGPEVGSGVDEVVTFLEPDDGVCSSRELNVGYQTAFGTSTLVKLDGCGADERGAKVIIVVSVPSRNAVIGIYVQSTETATALLPFAQQVFESITTV
jgi:hypothetical protein